MGELENVKMYVTKTDVKRVTRELNKLGLKGFARQLREKPKVTYEELAQYQARLNQANKSLAGISKTDWEKEIVSKFGKPDGKPSKEYWMTENEKLSEILLKDPEWRSDFEGINDGLSFGFYTYTGEVCVLVDGSLDCDFDSFPVDFQREFWKLIKEGKYKQ